jgi:hypothetical protein
VLAQRAEKLDSASEYSRVCGTRSIGWPLQLPCLQLLCHYRMTRRDGIQVPFLLLLCKSQRLTAPSSASGHRAVAAMLNRFGQGFPSCMEIVFVASPE